MNIHELCEATDLPPRQIRHLIAEDLLPPPLGSGRAATYGEEHVLIARECKALIDEGWKVPLIKARRGARKADGTIVFQDERCSLLVHPDLASLSDDDLRSLLSDVERAVTNVIVSRKGNAECQ